MKLKIYVLATLLATGCYGWVQMTGEQITTNDGTISWHEIFSLRGELQRLKVLSGITAANLFSYITYQHVIKPRLEKKEQESVTA